MKKPNPTEQAQILHNYMLKNINDLLKQHEILARQHQIERQCHLDIIKECKRNIRELEKGSK